MTNPPRPPRRAPELRVAGAAPRLQMATAPRAPGIQVLSRGNLAESRIRSKRASPHPDVPHPEGGVGHSFAAAGRRAAPQILRRQLPHFLRLPLRPSLVQSLKHQMVRGLLANHLASAGAAVGGHPLLDSGPEPGVYGGGPGRHSAAGCRQSDCWPRSGLTASACVLRSIRGARLPSVAGSRRTGRTTARSTT